MKHLTEQEISGYAKRTLGVQALLPADDHLKSCLECCMKLQSVLQANRGGKVAVNSLQMELTALDEDLHLSFEQIIAFLEMHLAGTEPAILTNHLSSCANCLAEVEDLRNFKQMLAAQVQAKVSAPIKKKDLGKFFRPGATR